MNIKGFDASFLKDVNLSDEIIQSEAFIEKVMIPSNYFDTVAAVAALVAADRSAVDAIGVFCEVIRNCKTTADYISYLDDVKNKDDKDYQEIIEALKTTPVDPAISFGTLITELCKYGFCDDKMYRFLMWVLVTGSYTYLKIFARYCEASDVHLPALAIITNMFQECKVITPFLYSYDDENYYEDLEEIYPEFYHYIESEYDLGEDYEGTLKVNDFISFMNFKRTQNNADAILVYHELIDLLYDTFDDDEEQYSEDYFLECLMSGVLVEIHNTWINKEKALAAENLICEFVSNFKDKEE